MGTLGVHMKGVLPWLGHWARRAGTKEFYPALIAFVSPVQNILFLTVNFFTLFVPIARVACLCVSGLYINQRQPPL
jgi:hypothetical protein